jgi:hypothetical protein
MKFWLLTLAGLLAVQQCLGGEKFKGQGSYLHPLLFEEIKDITYICNSSNKYVHFLSPWHNVIVPKMFCKTNK